METNEITWSNILGSRSRRRWLILVKEGHPTIFAGKSLPGLAVVVRDDWKKNGKWSGSNFVLRLGTDVRAIAGTDGWNGGTFREGLESATGKPTTTWAEATAAAELDLAVFQAFVRAWRPKAAEYWDNLDKELASLV